MRRVKFRGWWMCVGILLCSMVSGTTVGSNLPRTISDGTYTSTDDTITYIGTELNVTGMLSDAASKGLPEAVCALIHTTFEGTLTIALPAAAKWITNNIPLRVLIQDGLSGMSPPNNYFRISGALSLGSSIIVHGGTYVFNGTFMHLNLRTIKDGSTLIIRGGTYSSAHEIIGGDMYLVFVLGPVQISNLASMSISDNNVLISNVRVVGRWDILTLYTTDSIDIRTGSLSIVNNKLMASNVSVGEGWGLFSFRMDNSLLSVATDGTLIISNNSIVATSVNVAFSWVVYTFYKRQSSSTTVTLNSAISVANNSIVATNSRVARSWLTYTFYTYSVSSTIVYSGGSISIANNKLMASTVSVGEGWEFCILYNHFSSTTTINSEGTISITSNTMSANNNGGHVPTSGVVWVNENLDMTVDGVMIVSGNTVEVGAGTDMNLMWLRSPSKLKGNGTVYLQGNTITTAGTMITVPAALDPTIPKINTCYNFVDGVRCVLIDRSVYSCVSASSLDGLLADCGTRTVTRSEPSTLSRHKVTKTLASTPTGTPPVPTQTLTRTPPTTTPASTTPTTTTTTSPLPNCPTSETCPYASSVTLGKATETHTNVTNSTSGRCVSASTGMHISVPFDTWGAGNSFHVSIQLNAPISSQFVLSSVSPQTTTNEEGLQYQIDLFLDSGGYIWILAKVTFIGPPTRSVRTATLRIQLPSNSFNCTFPGSASSLAPIEVTLEAATPPISESITTVLQVAVVVSIMSVVPSALVRAGMINTITRLLYCAEFDPEEEVGFVNNPLGLTLGREELRYHRGSAVTGLMILGTILLCILVVAVVVRTRGMSVKTWGDTIDVLRMPSFPIVAMLLLSEVSVSAAISMMFYNDRDLIDVVLALVVLTPQLGYVSMYMYKTIICSRYMTFEEMKGGTPRGVISKFMLHTMEPTHDVVLLTYPNMNEEEETECKAAGESWLRRNYYFVAERRWAPYGAIEVIGGTLTNMVEGYPLTTTSRIQCIGRPACVMLITATLLLLLVWKTPNAVRMQHWCSLFVMGGMLLTSVLATVSAASPSENIELAAGYTGVIVVGVSMVLGVVDGLVIMLAYIPALRKKLCFRARGLQAVINRSKELNERAVPLLNVVPAVVIPVHLPPNPPPAPPIIATTSAPRHVEAKPACPRRPPAPPLEPAPPPPTTELSAAEIQMLKEIIASVDEFDRKKAAAESKNKVEFLEI